jgi:hypothetical protein
MRAAGVTSPVPLDELESHLREDVEKQMESGLGEQEAFDRAIQNIGKPRIVHTEFAKVEPVKKAREQILLEILLVVLSVLMPLMMGVTMLFKGAGVSELTSRQQISGLAAIATFSFLMWGGRLGYAMFPAIPAKRLRDAIVYSCGVPVALWWIVSLCVIAPRCEFTISQFVVAFLWAFLTPAGVWLCLFFGIETAARKRAAMPGS